MWPVSRKTPPKEKCPREVHFSDYFVPLIAEAWNQRGGPNMINRIHQLRLLVGQAVWDAAVQYLRVFYVQRLPLAPNEWLLGGTYLHQDVQERLLRPTHWNQPAPLNDFFYRAAQLRAQGIRGPPRDLPARRR